MREGWSEHLPVKSFSSSSWPRRTAPLKVEHLGSPRSRTPPLFILKDAHSFTDSSVLHANRGPTAQCSMRNLSRFTRPESPTQVARRNWRQCVPPSCPRRSCTFGRAETDPCRSAPTNMCPLVGHRLEPRSQSSEHHPETSLLGRWPPRATPW